MTGFKVESLLFSGISLAVVEEGVSRILVTLDNINALSSRLLVRLLFLGWSLAVVGGALSWHWEVISLLNSNALSSRLLVRLLFLGCAAAAAAAASVVLVAVVGRLSWESRLTFTADDLILSAIRSVVLVRIKDSIITFSLVTMAVPSSRSTAITARDTVTIDVEHLLLRSACSIFIQALISTDPWRSNWGVDSSMMVLISSPPMASFTSPSMDSSMCSSSMESRLDALPCRDNGFNWGANDFLRVRGEAVGEPNGESNGVICGVKLSVENLRFLTLSSSSSLSGNDRLLPMIFDI